MTTYMYVESQFTSYSLFTIFITVMGFLFNHKGYILVCTTPFTSFPNRLRKKRKKKTKTKTGKKGRKEKKKKANSLSYFSDIKCYINYVDLSSICAFHF